MRARSCFSAGWMALCLLATGPGFAEGPGFIPAPRFFPPPAAATLDRAPQRVGAPATDLEGVDATGAPMRLSQFRGKVILLDVSAMWCVYCQQDAPSVQYLYQAYGPKGLAVVTCLTENSNGGPVTPAGLKQWIATYHLTQGVMNDASGTRDGAAEQAYVTATGGFPTLAVIDRNFTVQYLEGGLDLPQVTAKIEALLAQ